MHRLVGRTGVAAQSKSDQRWDTESRASLWSVGKAGPPWLSVLVPTGFPELMGSVD
jgi:hypothetical protein